MILQNLKASKRTIASTLVTIALTCGIIYQWHAVGKVARSPSQPDAHEIEQLRQLAAADTQKLADGLDLLIVRIDAGDFIMGSDSGRNDERPQHTVYLDAFEIDRYEITNVQYLRFLKVTGRPTPNYWTENRYPNEQADYPVVGVSWDDADAYCTWVGKRLPTEAEWEKACRGTDARVYPWGNAWEPQRANVDVSVRFIRPVGHNELETSVWDTAWRFLQATAVVSGEPGLRPVGSYLDGASPYGIMDMVGNASEWVADWYNWSDYSKMPTHNPRGLVPPWNHCLRGSPWHDPVGNAVWVQDASRCSARDSSHASRDDPRLGFRCARSVVQ